MELVLPADARFPARADAVPHAELVPPAQPDETVPARGIVPAAAIAVEVAWLPDAERSVPDDCSQAPEAPVDAAGWPASPAAAVEPRAALPVPLRRDESQVVPDAAPHSRAALRFVVVQEFRCARWAAQPAAVPEEHAEASVASSQPLAGSLPPLAASPLQADRLPLHSHVPAAP